MHSIVKSQGILNRPRFESCSGQEYVYGHSIFNGNAYSLPPLGIGVNIVEAEQLPLPLQPAAAVDASTYTYYTV